MYYEPIGCFWQIKDISGSKGYLLGSIPHAPDHLLKLNSKIKHCFQKAHLLAVEINPTAEAFLESKSKRTLSSLRSSLSTLSREQWHKAVNSARLFLPKMGYKGDIDKLNETRLIIEILKLTEENLTIKVEGYDSGMDHELLRLSIERKLPIIKLEDSRSHILSNKKTIDSMLSDLIQGNSLNFFGPMIEFY